MGKSGGGENTTTATSYTSQLPEYARGFYTRLANQAQAAYDDRVERSYDENGGMFYQGPRRAGQSQEEQAAADYRRDMFYNPDNAYANYAAQQMNRAAEIPGQIEAINGGGPFNAGIAQQYMSPYMDAVTNKAVREADLRYQQDADQRRAGMAASGGRGGYREAIMDVTGQTTHAANIGDLWATGRQSAFENAQSQYERDMQRQMGAGIANQGAQLDLMGRLSGLGLQGLQMGGEQQRQNLANVAQFEGVGQANRADVQADYDIAYNDWLAQRDFEINQYSNYMGLLSGIPVAPNQNQTNYSASPGIASQIAGAGLGAYGLGSLLGE